MKIRFYCGMGAGGGWKAKTVHRLISVASKECTHVELEFSDGVSFSSEFGVGPRLKKIEYSHPERWITIDLSFITADMEREILLRAKSLIKLREAGMLKYDARGAIGCLLTGRDVVWRYFCSEVVYSVLCPSLYLPEKLNYKMEPHRLKSVIEALIK